MTTHRELDKEHRLRCWGSQPPRDGERLSDLKIQGNETDWRTADLRRFFAAGLRAMHVSLHRSILVLTRTRDDGICNGRATIGGRWMKMCLPRSAERIDWKGVAQVFEHEVQHNLGLRHRDMPELSGLPVPWHIEGMRVRLKPVRQPKAPRDPREVKLERARAAVARWERKAKLARTKLAKASATVRRLEKKLLAASPAQQQPKEVDDA